jgi:hypothetical protein
MAKTVTALLLLAAAFSAAAQNAPDIFARRTYAIGRAAAPITIDGIIRQEEWIGSSPIAMEWETNPGDNIPAPVRSEALLAHDDQNLYVAFRAYDPDPQAIRAHLTDRDRAYQDDFIGIVVDTFNDERRAFEFFVNPLGVQMDLTNNDVGGDEDDSWDAIWDSAGRIHADRWEVELAIPFSALRFRASEGDQTWGLDLVRIYPRSQRHRIGLNPLSKNRNCYICQFAKLTGFRGIRPGRDIELDPTVTAHRTDVRASSDPAIGTPGTSPGSLRQGDVETDPGLSAKWGVTPNLTLNAAVNPDFSQVEADSLQLDINQTFALFFNEKRPFFLEGADFFETPLDVVYTRTVTDPSWGTKLTGKEGKSGGGLFIAQDSVTNIVVPGAESSRVAALRETNLAAVLRYRYDIGKNSTLGALFTNRSGGDYMNRVAGVDGFLRPSDGDSISAQFVTSRTEYPDSVASAFDQPSGTLSDHALRFDYRHETRHWFWKAIYTDVGTHFRADAGFMPQVDYRRPEAGLQYTWHGEKGKNWWSRIWLGGDWDRTETQSGRLLEDEYETWLQFQGPMQSFISFDVGIRDRSFRNRDFENQRFFNFFVEATPHKSLYLYFEANGGDHIDFAEVRPAKRLRLNPYVRYRATRSLEIALDHTQERLDVDGGRLFTADLTEARIVYQFNIRMFVRALVQYTDIKRDDDLYETAIDDRSKRLFPQVLFSYKINPQTVLFVGYSSTRQSDELRPDLLENDRTLFIKLGYAWLF